MFGSNNKVPKLQAPDKNSVTIYCPHNLDLSNRTFPDRINVLSIDPAIRNLAIRMESRPMVLSKDKSQDNTKIETIFWDKLHIKDEERKVEENNLDNLYFLITNFLDKYLQYYKTLHIIVIERQIPKNYKAVRISQHIISYFLFNLRNIEPYAVIFEVDPKLKSKELTDEDSRHLNERGLKKWAVEKATELLTKRKDEKGLVLLKKEKKKDDHSDTLIQIEAVFSYFGWPLTVDLTKIINKPVLKITDNKSDKSDKIVKLKIVK